MTDQGSTEHPVAILVCWYSHTGQTEAAVRAMIGPLEAGGRAVVTWHHVRPTDPLPFPFRRSTFFGLMPEIVREEPLDLAGAAPFETGQRFDLVVLACPVWFLTPARPMVSFLDSPEAAVVADTPVVVVMTCRALWSAAARRLGELVGERGGTPVGTVVATSTQGDLVSALTTNRWFFRGKKRGRFLPDAGVPESVLASLDRWAPEVLAAARGRTDGFIGATPVVTPIQEAQQVGGRQLFLAWAERIHAAGPIGSPSRALEVARFVRLTATLELKSYWSAALSTARRWVTGPEQGNHPL